MKKLIAGGVILLFFLCLPSLGLATVIDFEDLTPGTISITPGIVYPDVTFTYIGQSTGTTFSVIGSSPGLPLSGNVIWGPNSHTENEFYKAIFAPGVTVNSVSVDMGDYGADQDEFVLYAYNSSDILIGSDLAVNPANTPGGLTLSVFTAESIAYVLFNETGNQGGYWGSAAFDNFTYEAAVPEPSTLLLIGTGLLGLAGFRRKFRK